MKNIALSLLFLATGAAHALSLDEYLGQVKEQHLGFQSAKIVSESASLRANESKALLMPQFYANGQIASDERETATPSFMGTKTNSESYTVGITQLTTFGLSADLNYNLTHVNQYGVNTLTVPQPNVYTGGPTLKLTQSLWRNGFGRETRASQELASETAKAQSAAEEFRATAILSEAEITYWRLALAREAVVTLKDTLERAEKIRSENARKARLELSDRADLLQSEAALLNRRLELQTAEDDEQAVARQFNLLRGREGVTVSERLVGINQRALDKLPAPARAELRADTRAALAQVKAAGAAAKIGVEKNRPTFNIFAIGSLNGRDPLRGEATSESLTKKHPYKAIGLNFSTAIDFTNPGNSRKAYANEVYASELNYERKLFEQEQSWADLSKKFSDVKARLNLAKEIEEAQKKKLDYERDRYRRGRTVTYQVLLFEQDYVLSRLATIRLQTEILSVLAQMKTFQESRGNL